MALDLTNPIPGGPASGEMLTMLQNLQPNIVKPHVREFLTILFLQFTDVQGGRSFIKEIASLMKSAHEHLQEVKAFKDAKTPGTPYIGLGLSAAGYQKLHIQPAPSDPSFHAGMHAAAFLNDPPLETWEEHLRDPSVLHAVILVGDMLHLDRDAALAQVMQKISAATGVSVIGTQEGLGQHNDNGEGIEHFGYVDGRSQPLFLTEDLDEETNKTDGTHVWKAKFPLKQVIVPDPAAPNPDLHFGSYFVFRKLEQNVKKFKTMEKDFAEAAGLEDAERGGGMLVGRFEDGTPITLQSQDGVESPVPNNFNYESDKPGGKCPFFGHIRKTNPRGSGGKQEEEDERKHLMARRGQTYGTRTDDLNDGKIFNKPESGVGLLFMAFNSDIAHQFEFTQAKWANEPGFPKVPGGFPQPGIDPVIGQLPPGQIPPQLSAPKDWGDVDPGKRIAVTAPHGAVTMKGGAYFFMPSLAFLRGLNPSGPNTVGGGTPAAAQSTPPTGG